MHYSHRKERPQSVNFSGAFCSVEYAPPKRNFADERTVYVRLGPMHSATLGTRVVTKLLKLLSDNFKHCPVASIERYHNNYDKNLEHDKNSWPHTGGANHTLFQRGGDHDTGARQATQKTVYVFTQTTRPVTLDGLPLAYEPIHHSVSAPRCFQNLRTISQNVTPQQEAGCKHMINTQLHFLNDSAPQSLETKALA